MLMLNHRIDEDHRIDDSLFCRVLSLASCRPGTPLQRSSHQHRFLAESMPQSNTSFGELTGLDVFVEKCSPQNGWKVKQNRYSKHPWKVAPEFCRSFKMVAARPQEDRLQEVFEEWRCQHDRINTSAEYCVRQAGGLQMPDTLSHITSYTWTPCNVRTWNFWAWLINSILEGCWNFHELFRRAFLEGLGSNFWRVPWLQCLEASRSLSVNRCRWSLDGPFSWPWYWVWIIQ